MTEQLIQLPTPGESILDTHDRIRRAGEVVPIELPGGVPAWLAVSHRAVGEILDDKSFAKNAVHCPALHDGKIPADWPLRALTDMQHMLNQDGAEHRRLRKTINKAFTPGRIAALAPRIEQIAAELIDSFPQTDEIDLISNYTTPLPVRVICELFGVPEDEQPQLKGWTLTIVSTESTGEQAHAAMAAMIGYFTELLDRKRRDPGDDLTSALLAANAENELTDAELVEMMWLLIVAGHETTVHLLGNAVVALREHPEQLAKAQAEDRWDDVVEEVLRYRSSVVGALMRYARTDVKVADVDIPAGAMMLWHGGVGRDLLRNPDADTFDIDHDHRDQLAFGHGPHFCLGAPLARLESRIALSTLFRRYPDLTLAIDPARIEYISQISTVGPLALPVRLTPAT
ncbi:cytochrome P450 family protein [Nocardia cyriacigeorgica]|uniref:cytochrome P450 family protein n=1 Tax=Nocardia cyriacigeorgica TaxID=135487 RepID=UPI002457B946|nr:cytochrome P450 [Nocardia cyriacigeorgica]